MKWESLTIAAILVGICVLPVVGASAQGVPDVLIVNYFANNGVSGAPDATVRVTNLGETIAECQAGPSHAPVAAPSDLCAMVYVFDNDQQMSECCGCITTPDGLRTLSVAKDLTSNPLTGVVSKTGDIKILSAVVNGSPCDPTNSNVIPALHAWATHIQNKVGTAYPMTETVFTPATLNNDEWENLIDDCFFIYRLGSGHGICSCGTGD